LINLKRIKLFTGADSSYFLQVAALLNSLSKTQDRNVDFTVIGEGWSSDLIAKICSTLPQNINVNFESISKEIVQEIKLTNRFPAATVYNLLGISLIFSRLEKIIYIDADTLVLNSLNEVWDFDFTEPLAAVPDSNVGVIGFPSMWRPWNEENCNPLAPYLNTGFLVINVALWNENKITERCVELLKKYSMPCIDQDALNIVLNGNFCMLHPKFNLMPYHLIPSKRNADLVQERETIYEAIESPVVVHFHRSILGKPWQFGCRHPATKLWRRTAKSVKPNWKPDFSVREFTITLVGNLLGMGKLEKNVTFSEDILKRDWGS